MLADVVCSCITMLQLGRRCRVVVCWCVSSRAGLQATWSPQLSVCRSTTVQCRRSSGAVVDLASQAAVVWAGRQPSTVRRTTDQATTAALSPAHTHRRSHVVVLFICTVVSFSGTCCYITRHELVSWCLTSLFSTNIWLYQRWKVRGGELSLPSIGRPAIY